MYGDADDEIGLICGRVEHMRPITGARQKLCDVCSGTIWVSQSGIDAREHSAVVRFVCCCCAKTHTLDELATKSNHVHLFDGFGRCFDCGLSRELARLEMRRRDTAG